MRTLFVHDHVFHRSVSGEYFSGGGLPKGAWDRYLEFSDSLTVVGRKGMVGLTSEQTGRLALSSRAQVQFMLLDSLSGPITRFVNLKPVSALLLKEIESSDRVIVRLPSELGLLAIEICHRLKKPVAVEMVDCSWDGLWNYGSLTAKVYAPIMYFRVKKAVKSVDYVIYVTSQFLQLRYPAKASALTSSCSNVMLPHTPDTILTNRLAKLSSGCTVFGLIGSLKGKLKGVYDAISALHAIKEECPDIKLRVLGDGDPKPFMEHAKKLGVADIVFFDGVLPGGAPVFDWLDKIDIYIHPSYKEGLPRAVIEAMSRGCPVAASSVAGTPELIDEQFLFKAGDVSALASKMRQLYNDESLRLSQSKRNFDVSRRYEGKVLEDIRSQFWSVFFNKLES